MVSLDWKALWNEAQSGSIMEGIRPEGKKWASYWDEESAGYLARVIRDEEFYQSIVDHLRRERIFCAGDSVLDVACGPGTYSLLFAETARKVAALDISSGMLSVLKEEAGKRGLANIRAVPSAWDDYCEPERFDLVFTALSPAIRGPEEFLRMESCSTRSCCYVAFGDEENFRVRNDLWRILFGEERKQREFNISYPFSLLVSMGRKPGIKYFTRESNNVQSIEKLAETSVRFFSSITEIDDRKRRLIEDYLNTASKDGRYEIKTSSSLVALYWDVPPGASQV